MPATVFPPKLSKSAQQTATVVQGGEKRNATRGETDDRRASKKKGEPKQIYSKSEVFPLFVRKGSIHRRCENLLVCFGSGAGGPSGNPFMNALSLLRQSLSGESRRQLGSGGSQDIYDRLSTLAPMSE